MVGTGRGWGGHNSCAPSSTALGLINFMCAGFFMILKNPKVKTLSYGLLVSLPVPLPPVVRVASGSKRRASAARARRSCTCRRGEFSP